MLHMPLVAGYAARGFFMYHIIGYDERPDTPAAIMPCPYISDDKIVQIQMFEYTIINVFIRQAVAIQFLHDDLPRWPEAESILATHASAAFYYAKYILKKRWPLGEHAILKGDLLTLMRYRHEFVRDEWPEGDQAYHRVYKESISGYSHMD